MNDEKFEVVVVEEDAFLCEEDEELSEEIGEDVPEDDVPWDDDGDNLRRIAELEDRLRAAEDEMARRQRELECMTLLAEAGLPSELTAAVMASEDMAQTVDVIRGAVRYAVAEEMRLRCVSSPPEKGKGTGITRDELLRLSVAELQRIHTGR